MSKRSSERPGCGHRKSQLLEHGHAFLPALTRLVEATRKREERALLDAGDRLDLSRRGLLERPRGSARAPLEPGVGPNQQLIRYHIQVLRLVAPATRAPGAGDASRERLVGVTRLPQPEARCSPAPATRGRARGRLPCRSRTAIAFRTSSPLAAYVPFAQPQLGGDETLRAPATRPPPRRRHSPRRRPRRRSTWAGLQLAPLDQRERQLDPHLPVRGIFLRDQLRRPPEQLDRGARVAAPGGALSGRAQVSSGAGGELCALLDQPELGRVAVGLLEVVAEDLVELDQIGAALARATRRSAGAARPWSPSEALRRRHPGSGGA